MNGEANPTPRILVFDIKRDYVHLAREFPDVWVFRLPGEGFRWNPLEPPVGDWRRWVGEVVTRFTKAWGMFGGQSSDHYAYGIALELFGKYDPDKGVYPCLLDLRDQLDWMKASGKVDRYSEEREWFARVRNRVKSLCDSLGETVNCSRGYPLADLLAHHVIFDMADMREDAQSFFTEVFCAQALWYRMGRGERGGRLRNLAVFDEGKRLLPRSKEEAQQTCNMSNVIALSREFGVGFIVADCEPVLLSHSIKSSAHTRVCFNLTHGVEVREAAGSLGLDREQAAEIQKLQRGEAIVRMSGRIGRPFVLRVTP